MKKTNVVLKKTVGLCALWVIFLGACSGPSTNRPIYQGRPIPAVFNSIENELQAAALTCETPGACPENVGMIYSRENLNQTPKPQVLQCTGFLVSENIVATNSHCIPEIIKQNPTSCRGLMAIKFVRRNRGQTEVFPCQRILNYSPFDNSKIAADYAFFEIAKTGIAPLNISQAGVANRQSLRVIKFIPSDQGGRLQIESCVSTLNSALNFSSASPWSKTAVAVHCHSAHGNSGSPVLNTSNQVIGILQSAYQEKQLQEIKSQAPAGTQLPDRLIPHFIWTNFACIPHPVNGSYEKEKCDAAQSLRITDCVQKDISTASAAEMKVNNEWTSRLPHNFFYEFQTDPSQQFKRAVPRCVKKSDVEKISLVYPGEIQFALPLHFDNEFRLISKTNFIKKSEINWQVSAVRSKAGWSVNISPLLSGSASVSLNPAAASSFTIPDCDPEDEQQGSTINMLNSEFAGNPSVWTQKDTSLCAKD